MKNTSPIAPPRGLYVAYVHDKTVKSHSREAVDNNQPESRLIVSTTEGIHVIPHDSIVYCQAKSNYTAIHLMDGGRVFISKTLKWVEQRLPCHARHGCTPTNFLRVHQTFLVQIGAVRMIETGGSWSCRLSNGQTVPVARSRREEVLSVFLV